MNAIMQTPSGGDIMETVLIKGDLSKLTPEQRADYYGAVCRSIGLNPLTRPFDYITLNGKLTLYAKRDAADQLRKINGISVEIVERSVDDGLITVHVRARDASGRTDEDFGVVNVAGLKGEAAANAMLKAVTKAKRRVTLSISGLGFLDETEVEEMPNGRGLAAQPPTPARLQIAPPHDPATGEIKPHAIPVPMNAKGDASDWIAWGQLYIAAVKSSGTIAEANAWDAENNTAINTMEQDAPKVAKRMAAAVAEHRATLVPAETPAFDDEAEWAPAV